jgi:O-antigen/teichoic acid export membrane protein
VAILLVGFGGPLVRLWMGTGFDESIAVMTLLVLGSLFQSQNVVAHVMLPGMGELEVFTRFMAAYPIVTAACAVTGIVAGGLVGLAAGITTAIVVMETVFVAVVRRRFGVTLRRFLVRCQLPVAKAAAPAVACVVFVRAVAPLDTWLALAAAVVTTGGIFAASFWTLGVTGGERRAVLARLAGPGRTAVSARLSGQPSC